MSLLTQLLLIHRGRPTQGTERAAVSIRRSLATATVTLGLFAAIILGPPALAKNWHGDGQWVGTWSVSPQPVAAPIQINGQTVRQIVRASVGGTHVRVRLSNAYGTSPLVIGAAHVALSAGGSSIVERTDRKLKFNGSPTVTIPAGALAVSDSVKLEVPSLGDVAVSLYLPENGDATTQHEVGLQTTYISDAGDFTAASTVAGTSTQSYYFLTGVEVRASERARAIVTLAIPSPTGSRQRRT